MIRSAVTISLVSQARGGPFVFWDDLPASIASAKACGFDAVEIFAPGPEALNLASLETMLNDAGLQLAAVGTGAGWLIHKLQLCDVNANQRAKSRDFIRSMIDVGGAFGAPAIIGSMQGRWANTVPREKAFEYLTESLDKLGAHAAQYNVPLLYEPLNRYETNLVNSIEEGVDILENASTKNVKLLADLFHMNIEEENISEALRIGGDHIGHVHFVDSNRRAAGCGHLDYAPIAAALREINYQGYASAEALSWPNAITAAKITMQTFREYFPR